MWECKTSDINGHLHGKETVAQKSKKYEKDRGYILEWEWNHGMLVGNEILNKFTHLSPDVSISKIDKCNTVKKIVIFEYEWKVSQPSTMEWYRKLNRLDLLIDDQKCDDFDRHAVECLYKWLHSRWVLK